MSNRNLTIAGVVAVGLLVLLFLVGKITYSNSEIRLRNQISATQRNLLNELDKTMKNISSSAQITEYQMSSIKDIIIGNAQARNTGAGGSLMTMLTESVPNIAPTSPVFINMMNLVTGARETFATKQTRILSMKAEHDNLRMLWPSSMFVGGRPEIIVRIVTSTKAENALATGKDDDDVLFKGKGLAPGSNK